ncbi:MAG: CotH kinase family protein, partial [Acidimicrobiia bacterium]
TGDYSYRGHDPEAYDEVFDQEAGKDNEDLTPLIEFLDFINNTDDATFNAELADHLDIESFATYLAMQDLIDNFDDINGPGNNSYLYYDSDTEIFTVVAWDHNLAFGVRNNDAFGPGEAPIGGPGGAPIGGPGGAQPQGAGLQPPAGGPAEAQLPEAGLPVGGPGEQANVLVDRFLANPEFSVLYDTALVELDASLYESGIAAEVLTTWVSVLEASDLVTTGTIAEESAQIAAYFGN